MNAAEFAQAMLAAKKDCDDAFDEQRRCIAADAEADRALRLAYNSAYLASRGTIPERAAHSEKVTVNERYTARMAEGLRRSAQQAVDYRIRSLSILQSLASLTKAEAQLAKWEPSEVA